MGNRISTKTETTYLMTREQPSPDTAATLYYFGGRGLADQIRWMLAANEITFCQKVVDTREKFVKMAERQLVFGQLPLLQIDGIEIVQSQAIVRYLANRSNMAGYSLVDKNRCDMIAETVRDMINLVAGAPFQRVKSAEAAEAYRKVLKDKWNAMAPRFEGILKLNGGKFLVGTSLTYADVLVAHMMTWYVEECGVEIAENTPYLVNLQIMVINLPGIQSFIKSDKYFPIGQGDYVQQVSTVLDRAL